MKAFTNLHYILGFTAVVWLAVLCPLSQFRIWTCMYFGEYEATDEKSTLLDAVWCMTHRDNSSLHISYFTLNFDYHLRNYLLFFLSLVLAIACTYLVFYIRNIL